MIIETKGYSCRKCQSEGLVKKRPPSNCKKIPVLEGEELWSFVFRSKDTRKTLAIGIITDESIHSITSKITTIQI